MKVGMRISASHQPCCGRRVVARKKRAAGDGFVTGAGLESEKDQVRAATMLSLGSDDRVD
ncbi:hypothetical protein RchiOBHm_Chr1g0381951 [Rosa chinensis]|uniref:Uncharacterized protein n=1 Tax=Rosa chinensis TaxID=74649 RepID=A0A2P6SPA0_ROSCH|nr:hypothetical protein RchiOBHm_Chr1g0381951 [Rosa chinensis]